jgi:hypothetical protein
VQVGDDQWIYRISNSFRHLEYKILIDDIVWEEGGNHTLDPEKHAEEAPYFNVPSTPIQGKTTRLSIRHRVTPGSTLSIGGTGPGLSWSALTPLRRVGDDLWIWETSRTFNNFDYKIVLGGNTWESGPNHRAKHGRKEEVLPQL